MILKWLLLLHSEEEEHVCFERVVVTRTNKFAALSDGKVQDTSFNLRLCMSAKAVTNNELYKLQ